MRFYTPYDAEETFELTFGSAGGDPPNWGTLVKANGVYGGTYTLSDNGRKIRVDFQPDQMSDLAAVTFDLYRHQIDRDPTVFSCRLDVVKAESGAMERSFHNYPRGCRML